MRLQTSCLNLPLSIVKFLAFLNISVLEVWLSEEYMGGLLDAELEFSYRPVCWDNIALGRGDSDIASAAIPINSNKTSGNLISFFSDVSITYWRASIWLPLV